MTCRVRKEARRRPRRGQGYARIGITLFVCLFIGCAPLPQWGKQIELHLLLPPPPSQWACFGALDYLILVPEPSEEEPFTTVRVPAGSNAVRLTVGKRTNLPLLAYPLLEDRPDLLRPSGGVYPLDLEKGDVVRLSYRDGFLAELLLPMCAAGDLLEALNVSRLRRETWDRSLGDPWSLDREAILETLLYGSMRSGRIRRRPSFELSIEVPAGTWVAGNPFIAPILAPPARPLLELHGLPTGVHRFFRNDDRIDVAVTEQGWLSVDRATGAAESGRW